MRNMNYFDEAMMGYLRQRTAYYKWAKRNERLGHFMNLGLITLIGSACGWIICGAINDKLKEEKEDEKEEVEVED